MKTLIAISLSLTVFFQGVGIDMSDVFMLSDLVEHAKLHSEEYGDDVFTFFEKHYGTLKKEHQKSHQGEKSPHEKLPFQHNNFGHLLPGAVAIDYAFHLNKSPVSFVASPHSYYLDLYSFLESTSIFQPPRTA